MIVLNIGKTKAPHLWGFLFDGLGRIAERRWLKEPTQLQWRVTLPSAIYFNLGIVIYNKVRKVPFQLSLIKKDTTKQRCCVRGGGDSTPLPNHKSSILQDQASPKLIEWVNNYIVSHSTHMMHITK